MTYGMTYDMTYGTPAHGNGPYGGGASLPALVRDRAERAAVFSHTARNHIKHLFHAMHMVKSKEFGVKRLLLAT